MERFSIQEMDGLRMLQMVKSVMNFVIVHRQMVKYVLKDGQILWQAHSYLMHFWMNVDFKNPEALSKPVKN